MKKNKVLLLIRLLCVMTPGMTQAISFNQISQVYFFGDSLTDSGYNNLYPYLSSPPYPAYPTGKLPTFTTYGGYTWAQYVAHDIKGFPLPTAPSPSPNLITNNTTPSNGSPVPVSFTLTGVDYACGGSRTNAIPGFGISWAPSLAQQITQFLSTSSNSLDPNAVYFIWSGVNDILYTLNQPNYSQLALMQTVNTATTNIVNEVDRLSARGANRIVVMALPDIGTSPFGSALAASIPNIQSDLQNLSFIFDSLLNQKLGAIIKQYHTKILYINSYEILGNMIIAAKNGQPYEVSGNVFYFTNYTTPACGVDSALYCPPGTPLGYIFADDVHPTDMAHQVIALEVEAAIQTWY